MQTTVKTFEEWITRYKDVESPRGNLAVDIAIDDGWPTGEGIESYRSYMGARPLEALNSSWIAYESYVQNVQRNQAGQKTT